MLSPREKNNLKSAASLVLSVALATYALMGASGGWMVGILAVTLFLYAIVLHFPREERIDDKFHDSFPRATLSEWTVVSHEAPDYLFADFYLATERFSSELPNLMTIESAHPMDLRQLLQGARECVNPFGMLVASSTKHACAIDYGETKYFPVDISYASTTSKGATDGIICRVRAVDHSHRVVIEIASFDPDLAQETLESIKTSSRSSSIYRGKVIEVSVSAGVKDEYGEVEMGDRVYVEFKKKESLRPEDVVVDDRVHPLLERNVLDVQEKRLVLRQYGVPAHRGVLLYGPPGTGKTFACRYLYSQFKEATTLVASGTTLPYVKTIFNVARMLQPTVVVLEDVDLVFSSRETSLSSSTLGDLFDQMDGLRPDEDLSFILTTNDIDRIEKAIKDRPGRIGQCVYFGPPNDTLRARYLGHYLLDYDTRALDMDALVHMSDGATQAFLKEWVHRAVQFRLEHSDPAPERLDVRQENFEAALAEMRTFSSDAAEAIIGFRSG